MKGVRRVVIFTGLGLNAAYDKSFRKYELPNIIQFQIVPRNADDKVIDHFKEAFAIWVISGGLRELMETFAIFLDSIHNVCILTSVSNKKIEKRKIEEIKASNRTFQMKGLKDKLKILKNRFGIKTPRSKYLISINQARHCFTHRQGIVGRIDCGRNQKLVIKWTGPDTYIETPSGEKISLDEPVDTKGIPLKDGGTIIMKWVEKKREVNIGKIIKFSPKDLAEICFLVMLATEDICKSVRDYISKIGIELTTS